jgi:hypothetical protein
LVIRLKSGERPLSVVIARNDDMRRRRIAVEAGKGAATLDFSSEPGTIEIGGERANGDPRWDSAWRRC